MTVGELYEGAYRGGWRRRKLAKLRETIATYVVIPFRIEVCREWGAIRCERRTRTIAVDNAGIAAMARAHRLRLLTRNPGGFSKIESLDLLPLS